MKQIHIGEIIKQRRLELKLTQEELCEGICEPPTMSRIEKGHQTPTHSKLKALLSRLNLSSEKYYAMMSENELEIEQLKDMIIDFNTRKLYAEALEKIDTLIPLADLDDTITQQFIIRSRVLCGKREYNSIIPYSADEKLSLLFEAIKMTIPNFDIDEIGSHWYSLEEMKIINHIALVYSENKQQREAVDIYYQLLKFIKRKLVIHSDNVALAILVSYNYCLTLSQMQRYDDAFEIAHWGWNKCIEWSRSGPLGGLLFVIGKCLYYTGKIEESKDYFIQSYYAFKSMRDISNSDSVKEDIKKYFDINL